MDRSVNEQTDIAIPQSSVRGNPRRRSKGAQRQIEEGGYTAKDVAMFAAESAPFLGEAIGIKRTSDALDEGDYVGAGIEGAATLAGVMPVFGDAVGRGIRALKPNKTVKAYKLFTKGEDGNLYPLFVDADSKIPQGEFISAVIPESVFTAPNGKKYVPSKGTGDKKGTGDNITIPDQATRDILIEKGFLPAGSKAKTVKAVALRPGFHAGDSPAAPHIGLEYKGQKYRSDDQVWAEVEMPADTDWQSVADSNASTVKSGERKGLLNVKEAQITDQLPSGGYYRYKTNPNMQGNWLISGEMKVNRVLEPDEVKKLNDEAGTPDLPTLAELKAAETTDAPAPRMGYDPNNESSRVFHLTKADFDTADVIGSGTSDIGFHVGTAQQATARGSTQTNYNPELAEQMVKGERILPMVLKADLKPARIVDMSNFKVPGSWLANLSVASSDLQRIKFLKGDESDAALFAKAPKVKVDGETYTMLPDAMRAGMDEGLWRDIVLEAHGAKRRGLDTINSQEDRIAWFNTLKETANKNGYDSCVYRNEYEGTANENIDELVEQIQRAQRGEIDPAEIDMNSRFADSYMLLEPNQVKGLFGGMTESSPEFMKNKGGLMLQEGGAVPMQKQMELFMDDYQVAEVGMDKPKKMQSGGFLKDGGLEQDGGTEDPVSGNDVPPGSSQEEVRDDIPAQLSEGEFVFPADVVRYIGLEKLMMMRQEAKMGLKMMEEMGQMGNSDEATMPDDLPFGITDLIIVDGSEGVDNDEDKEYNTGGVVFGNDPNTGVTYQAPQFQAGQTQVGMAASPIEMAPIARPEQQATPVYQAPQTLPTASEFIKPPEGTAPTTIVIVNEETGEERTITFIPGVTEIPQGFVRKEDYVPKEVVPETPTTTVQTEQVLDDPGKEDDDARRRQALIDQYGNDSARIGLLDFDGEGKSKTYGVNYLDGMGFGLVGVGQVLSGKVPDDATIMLKDGDDEIYITGKQWKTVRAEIKAPGTDYTKTREIFREARDQEASDPDIIAAKRKREKDIFDEEGNVIGVVDRFASARKQAQQRREIEARREAARKAQREKAADEAARKVREKAEKDRIERAQEEAVGSRAREEAFGRRDDSSDTGFERGSIIDTAVREAQEMVDSGYFDENKGGLMSNEQLMKDAVKKSTKKKKMKRGGLASKK